MIGIHAPVTGASPIPQTSFDTGKDIYWKFLAQSDPKALGGRKVRVVFRDDEFNPSTAVQVCREMVEKEHAFILVGGGGADQITACAKYANQIGVPYFSAGVNEDGPDRPRHLLRGVAHVRGAGAADHRPAQEARGEEGRVRRHRHARLQGRARRLREGRQGVGPRPRRRRHDQQDGGRGRGAGRGQQAEEGRRRGRVPAERAARVPRHRQLRPQPELRPRASSAPASRAGSTWCTQFGCPAVGNGAVLLARSPR